MASRLRSTEGGPIICFKCLDMHHKPLDSRARQYKSRTCPRRFGPARGAVEVSWVNVWQVAEIRECLDNGQPFEEHRLSLTLSVGTPLCPYGIAYRRVHA